MITILMAVYNGEKYLAQQIESLLGQTYSDYTVIICDDNSTDNSYSIAAEYAGKYPDRISLKKNDVSTGSACANFMKMISETDAEYIMFCDQDDLWYPDKIELTLKKMAQLENEYGNIPLLVHTELEIVNSELDSVHKSFTAFQGLNPQLRSINRLLCQNNITGCTVMINKELAKLLKAAPASDMLMHDWWAALIAASMGRIAFIDTPLIKYRQHGNNSLGAVNNRSIRGALRIVFDRVKTKKRVSITYSQANAFMEMYRDILSEKVLDVLELYVDIPNHCKPVRIYKLIRYNFLKQNFMTAVGQLIFC